MPKPVAVRGRYDGRRGREDPAPPGEEGEEEHYYVVTKGHRPGIYTNSEDFDIQMRNFKGSVGRKVRSKAEAYDILRQAKVHPSRIVDHPAGLATNSIVFCFPFEKNHRFAWRANQGPLFGEFFSYPFLPATLSQTIEWFFELTRLLSRAFNSPHLMHCYQNYRETRTPGVAPGPRTTSTINANLDSFC